MKRHPELKTQVIGLSGPAKAGKDTVARMILNSPYGVMFDHEYFARSIKDMLHTGFSLTWNELNGPEKDDVHALYGTSPRELLQTLGTEWGRNLVHPDIWILTLMQRTEGRQKHLVISDVRFENEAKFCRNFGVLWHIQGRGGIEGDHASEAGVSDVPSSDFYIDNSGDFQDLHKQVIAGLEDFFGDA